MRREMMCAGCSAAVLVAALGAGCGSSTKSSGFAPDGGAPAGDASLTGPGPDGGTKLVGDGSTTVACTGPHCSSDLHSLVDCNGKVIMTCPPTQGCVGTGCADACAAASADKSTIGCEYYVVDPDILTGPGGGAGACFAAYIANTWDTPVTVSVDFGGTKLDASKFAYAPVGSGQSLTYQPLAGGVIPPGQVAVLFLNRYPASVSPGLLLDCPSGVTAAVTTMDAAVHGTGMGSVFHVTTTAPVAAYDIFPFGGGQSAMTSATLLLPTSAWDTNYVAVNAYGPGPIDQPTLDIVASQDGTQVTIDPIAAIAGGGGVAAAVANKPTTYTLHAGQLLQFTQDAPLGGSIIQTNNPVGVWAGKSALSITSCCDDSAHQQIPPIRALGSEYVGVRYRNRYSGIEEAPPWQLVGAVKGTVLSWDPVRPSGAPTALDPGVVAVFSSNGPFVVKSQDDQHPFYMSAHMTGAEQYDKTKSDGRGDAEFVNVVPPGEYLTSYTFFTDPTYPETDLVFVRAKGSAGFADVKLDCAGTLSGWAPIGTTGDYEYTRFDLVTGNFQGQGGCNNGRHVASSTAPFGLTVWGWGSGATGQQGAGFYTQYVSYAYPAGAGVKPINTVVVQPGAQ